MKTIPDALLKPARDRFQISDASDLHPLAEAARDHTRAGIARYERLAEFVLLTAARANGLLDDDTVDMNSPCVVDTIAASLARNNGYRFAGPGDGDRGEVDRGEVDRGEVDRGDAGPGDGGTSPENSTAGADPALFPGFALDMTFHQWTHENLITTDTPILGTLLGTSVGWTETLGSRAMTLVQGLPRFLSLAKAGAYTMEHVDTAARLCSIVAFKHLPDLDDYLSRKRADITVDTFRRALKKKLSLLEEPADWQEVLHSERRVVKEITSDGTGYLTLIGPALEIDATYRRVEAMARAIRLGNTDAFGLDPGETIDDDRSIAALMYDILARPVPALTLTVTSTNPATGIDEDTVVPWTDDPTDPLAPGGFYDPDGNLIPVVDDSEGTHCRRRRDCFGPSAFDSDAAEEAVVRSKTVTVRMPTADWWLASQAKLITTVPFLTAFGDAALPGHLPDGSPIPADIARHLVGCASSLTRVLTDPATGTPLDAKALTYRIPTSVRTALIAKWAVCSVPGCTRRADTSEIDHIEEFFHLNPAKGGLTRFGNLQPQCSVHHGHKTARNFDVTVTADGELAFAFGHGVTTTVSAPDDPINAEQARMLHTLCEPGAVPLWEPIGEQFVSAKDDSGGPDRAGITISPGLQEKWARGLRSVHDLLTRVSRTYCALQRQLYLEWTQWVRLHNCVDWENASKGLLKELPPGQPALPSLSPGEWGRARMADSERRAAAATRMAAEAEARQQRVSRRRHPWEILREMNWHDDPDDLPPF